MMLPRMPHLPENYFCLLRGWKLRAVTVLCLLAAGTHAVEAADASPRRDANKVSQQLAELAIAVKYLPVSYADIRHLDNATAKRIRALSRHAEALSDILATVESPRERGLAAALVIWGGNSSVLRKIGPLLDDESKTIPTAQPFATVQFASTFQMPLVIKAIPQSVRSYTRALLAQRFGRSMPFFGPVWSRKVFDKYLAEAGTITELPSEWVFRFRLAKEWKRDLKALRRELSQLKMPARGICTASVAAFVKDVYTDNEVADTIAGIDKKTLRALLEGKWTLPGMSLRSGPNAPDQMDLRKIILRVAPKVLAKEDAQWVYDAAKWPLSSRYVIAAAKLHPENGVGWLKKAILKNRDQFYRCEMLEAIWVVGGKSQMSYIKDRYFADSKPEFSFGGLQQDLIERLGKNEGAKAAALLKALVLDRRFTTLGWAATLAFARNATIILGEQTKEAKRYLGVQHQMGIFDFERHPEKREKYLVDTKHVLMQTDAFQIYLQGEVLKRSQRNNGQE